MCLDGRFRHTSKTWLKSVRSDGKVMLEESPLSPCYVVIKEQAAQSKMAARTFLIASSEDMPIEQTLLSTPHPLGHSHMDPNTNVN